MRNFLKIFIVVIVCAAFTLRVSAQIKNEQVDVVKDYQAAIADAVKESFTAMPATADSSYDPLEYTVKPHLLKVAFHPDPLKPLALPKQEEPLVMQRFIKAGFGTQWTPLAEVYVTNGRSDQFNYGVSFNHLSSNGNLKHQNFSDNHAKLFGDGYLGNVTFGSEFFYNREVINFYGYDHNDVPEEINELNLKQPWQEFGFNLNFGSNKKLKSGFDYSFGLSFSNLEKNPKEAFLNKVTENYGAFNGSVKKEFGDQHTIHFDALIQQQQLQKSVDTSETYFAIQPSYEFHIERLQLQGGLSFAGAGNQVKVFPNLYASYKLVSDYAVLYCGYKGTIGPVLLHEVYKVNPFIDDFDLVHSLSKEAYAGIKGSYGNNISYGIRLAYQSISNYSLYLPDTSLIVPTVYDWIPYDAQVLNFHAEVGYRQAERINVILSGEMNSFNLDYNDEPWGIPQNKLQLSVNYNIQDKIIAATDLFAYSGIYTVMPGDSQQKQLDGTLDLNFSLTYNYKKNISFFAMLNNMAASKYERYYQYPSYGFQALAGAMLKF